MSKKYCMHMCIINKVNRNTVLIIIQLLILHKFPYIICIIFIIHRKPTVLR